MRRFATIIALLFTSAPNVSAALPVDNATQYEITTPQDTIRFIRITEDSAARKPVLLFLQGSLPYPLVVTEGSKASVFYLNQCDFDYAAISKEYNIILIAKPHTPVVADVGQLNDRWQYVPDPSQPERFDAAYLADDKPDRYVERANAVLDFIRSQPWADPAKIIVLGHSQGAHIAARVAATNPGLYAVGYFSGNPSGRFAELIAQQDNAAKSGRITRSEAQENIERLYDQWRKICRGTTDGSGNDNSNASGGDSRETWIGFSLPYPDVLAALPMPLYIAYGTEDPGGQSCVLLPVYFELAGKRNYRLRAFEGRGHNFEVVRADGSSDYEDIQWKQAIGEFLVWCKNPGN